MDLFDWLADPFPTNVVKWRAGPKRQSDGKIKPLAYVDARIVMQRLDDVLGPENWQDEYIEAPKRIICRIGIKIDGEWIWKSDGAGDTDMEGEKGGMSDAFKRAAVKFGIGRYLYGVDADYVEPHNGKYLPWGYDGGGVLSKHQPAAWVKYMELVRDNWETIEFMKNELATNNIDAAREAYKELDVDVQKALWKAPTKGGVFTTLERDKLKQPEKYREDAA